MAKVSKTGWSYERLLDTRQATTKIQNTPTRVINNMNEAELKSLIKSGLSTSYGRMERIKKAGFELGDYNENFKDMFGQYKLEATKKVDATTDIDSLRAQAQKIKIHLNADESSLKGIKNKELNSLDLLNKIAESTGGKASKIKPVAGTYKEGGWMIDGVKITHEELSEFWEMIRDLEAGTQLNAYKGNTDDTVSFVSEKFFSGEIRNKAKMSELLDDIRKKEALKRAQQEEEKQKELERVRKARKRPW